MTPAVSRGTAMFRLPQTHRAAQGIGERHRCSPVDVQLNVRNTGWMSLSHMPARWVVLCKAQRVTTEPVPPHTGGANTGLSGRADLGSTRVAQASPSPAEPRTVLGPRVDQDGIFCLPHWVALNMGGLPTHLQAGDTSQVHHKDSGIPSPQARESPSHSLEHLSLTDHKDLDSESC